MRVDGIRIQNIRIIEDSFLDLLGAKLVVIKGANHEGKSTVGQSFSLLFTPSTDGLDPLGRGFTSKIRRGQPKGIITGDIAGSVHKVRRIVTLNTNSTGREEKMQCIDDKDWHPLPLAKYMDANRAALSVALNTDNFLFELDEARQKALLSSLVLPGSYDFPADIVSSTNRYLGEGFIEFTGDPLKAIEKAYKKLFEERTSANRRVKDFSIPDAMPIPQGIDSKGIEAEIEELTTDRNDLLAKKKKADAKIQEATVARARIDQSIRELRERLSSEKQRLDAVIGDILTDTQHTTFTAMAKSGEKLNDLVQKRRAAREKIDAKTAIMDGLESSPDAGSECPSCHQIVNEEVLKKLNADAFKERQRLEAEEADLWQQIKNFGDIDGAKQSLFRHDKAIEEKKRLEGIIAEKNRTLTVKQTELNKATTVEPDKYGDKISFLDTAIEEKRTKLRPAIVAEERGREIENKKAELQALQDDAKELDRLVKYFDKDGIKATLLAQYIGEFTGRINKCIEAWGYSCAFSIEPYEFKVTDTRGVTTPVRELSGSERLMFSIAMQCAVSAAVGFKIVVCDRMDTFLPAERRKANGAILDMLNSGALEQAVLIVADDSTNVPAIMDAAFFMVDNGRVSRLT